MKKIPHINIDKYLIIIYLIFIFLFLHNLLFSQKVFIFKDLYVPYDSKNYFLYAWDEELLGHINIFTSIDGFSLLSNHILGVLITQKILFMTIFILPYISFYFLLRNIFSLNPLSSFLASIVYSLNPITMDLLWGGNGAISTGIIYGVIPIIYYLIIKIYYSTDLLYTLLCVMIISFISYNLWQLMLLLIPILLFHFLILMHENIRPNLSNSMSKIFLVILLSSLLSLPNLFFNFSRTYIFEDIDTASDIMISNLKWGYQYIGIDNLLQLTFNPSNYFVYRNCYLLNNCNYGYFYIGMFVFLLFGLTIIGRKKWDSKMMLGIIFSIIFLISIFMISYIIKNFQLNNKLILLLLSIVRNPDKLLMDFIFFISISLGIMMEILSEKYKSKKTFSNFFIGILILFIILSMFLLPILDGFGGLTKYYFSDFQSNLELLTITKEKNLPYLIDHLNISKERILYLPYCSNSLFAAGDQAKSQPYFPNILGIRIGGTQDGYNQRLINNLFGFYSSISENKSNITDSYLELLGTNYVIISKNIDNNMNTLTIGISKVPYICGSSKDFIDIFKNLNFVPIFEDKNYIIFKRTEESLPIIYGLTEYNITKLDLKKISGTYDDSDDKYFYCNNCIVGSNYSNNYRLRTGFDLVNSGKENWHTFSIYLFGDRNKFDWNKFVRIAFLDTGGIEIGKSEHGKYYPFQKFEKTPAIIKGIHYDVEILKLNNYLEIKYQNRSLDYVDPFIQQLSFILIRFDNSDGYFSRPSMTSIDIVDIGYNKINPTKYLINTTENITQIIFSENYDSNWIVQSTNKKINSENSFLGLNSFSIEKNKDNSLVLYYDIQKISEIFKLISIITLSIILIILIKRLRYMKKYRKRNK